MTTAIFGISNSGLNLVVNLFVLMLVVVWLALIVFTYLDAKRRIADSFLVGCATVASFIPFIGTAVYAILRPPEFLEDARERELEVRAAELRVSRLEETSCPGCRFPIERDYLRCPSCQRRLKHPCPSCGSAVDPRWALCPMCETELPGAERQRGKRDGEKRRPAREGRSARERKSSEEPKSQDKRQSSRRQASAEDLTIETPPDSDSEPAPSNRPKRSTTREQDPDPR